MKWYWINQIPWNWSGEFILSVEQEDIFEIFNDFDSFTDYRFDLGLDRNGNSGEVDQITDFFCILHVNWQVDENDEGSYQDLEYLIREDYIKVEN